MPDWIVTGLSYHPGFYRYHVEGVNLNHPEGHPDRHFSWRVPSLCERYDLSALMLPQEVYNRG